MWSPVKKNVPATEPGKVYQVAVIDISHFAMVVSIKFFDPRYGHSITCQWQRKSIHLILIIINISKPSLEIFYMSDDFC